MEASARLLRIAVVLSAALLAGLEVGARARARAGTGEDDRPCPTSPPLAPLEPSPDGEAAPPRTHERVSATAPEDPPIPSGRSGPGVPQEGRTAALSARITRAGSGVPARLEFLTGLEAGTVLCCDASGRLEASGLYPGSALVRVSAPGMTTLVRELALRPASAARLELDTALRAALHGRVLDEEGRALAGARVSLDGETTTTDGSGGWQLECTTSGAPLLIVQHEGHAAHREALRGTADGLRDDAHDVVLSRGCELELAVRGADPGESVRVYLLPRGGQPTTDHGAQSAVPWHLLDPAHVVAGVTSTLCDLPSGRVEVVALHHLGAARSGVLCLRPGERTRVELELRPRPRIAGRVLRDGEPVAGARVVLEAANRVRASAASLGGGEELSRSVPLADLPAARQTTRTDRTGAFVLGDWGDCGGERYLTVTSPDAALQLTRRLGRSRGPLILDLGAQLEEGGREAP